MLLTPTVVWTEDPGGGNRVYLNRLGQPAALSGLQWSTTYPGGDNDWSATLSFEPTASHLGLRLGRKVVIARGGATRFQGRIDIAQRGNPWQLSGQGLAQIGAAFTAVDSGGNAYNLNNIIDQAIARGLPWTRPASLPTAGAAASGSGTIDNSLATVGKAQGQAWSLTALGAITMAAPPTTPIYILRAAQALTPRVVGYTQAVGVYQSSTSATATVTASNAAAQGKWGHIEGRYDMTGLGVITSGTASTYLANWLTANLAQASYTDTIAVQPGQLLAAANGAAGGPVDLATVRAGCLITVFDIDPDHSHLLTPGPLQMLVGRTEYDNDTDTLTLTPVGVKGTSLLAALYGGLGVSI